MTPGEMVGLTAGCLLAIPRHIMMGMAMAALIEARKLYENDFERRYDNDGTQ